MNLSDFDFELPEGLIAQRPLAGRSDSRLLDCSGTSLRDRTFTELPDMLHANDLLVLNDTRVIKARLFGHKATGGRVEILVERIHDDYRVLAQLRASHAPATGSSLRLGASGQVQVLGQAGGFYTLRFSEPVATVLANEGEMPLPPYIGHREDALDLDRYQTVFARAEGAVAAPTAGLHFDHALFDALRLRGVQTVTLTLHVGAGTFQPIRTEQISEHTMHAERYWVSEDVLEKVASARRLGGRVIAVGTTSVRALESAAESGSLRAGPGETRLFITPGYKFKIVDAMITNFHLPRSTLIVLVSAFAGSDLIRRAYAHAIAERYRFFSYGDAMFLSRA